MGLSMKITVFLTSPVSDEEEEYHPGGEQCELAGFAKLKNDSLKRL
jgi:hypothetical protein